MPYQVQQLIKGKGYPVCVKKEEQVSRALSLMIEHDYSQLPVVVINGDFDLPEGMITYEGILRGIRNFRAKIEDLKVRDVMVAAPVYSDEDDLFDILDRLKETNAVLVVGGPYQELAGIVTSYDTAEYFRNRTEDLMRVEDIELMVKEFIKTAHMKENGEVNTAKLDETIAKATQPLNKEGGLPEKKKTFDDLTLTEYISILIMKESWSTYEPFFGVPRDFVRELLFGVRDIRNALAHFRGDITAEQRDKLKFGAEWLSRKQEDYQVLKQEQERKKALEILNQSKSSVNQVTVPVKISLKSGEVIQANDFSITGSSTKGGRYEALADWLQSQPGKIDQIPLSFNQVEEIIQAELPSSARNYRAWWANDAVGHSHSQLWLEAGWRTTYVNLTEGKVTFTRIREREKAYINFYSKLLDELHKNPGFKFKNPSPDGASWIIIQSIQANGTSFGSFSFAFSRDKRFRVELYLDLWDQTMTKVAFDILFSQKEEFETQIGPIEWERLDNRRASRIAIYHEGQITDTKKLAELCEWGSKTMIKFVEVFQKPTEEAIARVIAK